MSFSSHELKNRFTHHTVNGDQNTTMESVRARVLDLAEDLNMFLPDGREKSSAFTKLEEVMFWANAAIAREPK